MPSVFCRAQHPTERRLREIFQASSTHDEHAKPGLAFGQAPQRLRTRRFRTGLDKPWMPLSASQYYTVNPPGFIWNRYSAVRIQKLSNIKG
jgi:hypothetical protein